MLTQTQVTVHRLAPDLNRDEWCRGLAGLDLDSCEVLKRDSESCVVATAIMGRAVVIKSHRRRGMVRGLRSWLGLSRDDRQWRGAELLQDVGIPTAEPLALVTRTMEGGRPEGLLVLERLTGPTLLEVLAGGEMGVRQEHALAREAGRIVGRLALAGIVNRDAKPSNWIVTSADPQHPGLALIDTVGVRRGSNPLGMLASMYIEALGTGCPPRRTLIMRCLLSAGGLAWKPVDTAPRWRAHGAWHMIAKFVNAHGDPRPRIDPLAPPRSEA